MGEVRQSQVKSGKGARVRLEEPEVYFTGDRTVEETTDGNWTVELGVLEDHGLMDKEKDILILAIESSCDETAAAVVKNGREVLSNVIFSQIDLHTIYGGVVPEIASRKHIEKINQVIEEALSRAGVELCSMDAVAVTYGPGLVGALLVGVSEAKAISFATGIPLIGVHHIEGHISANFIENKDLELPLSVLWRPEGILIWWW